MRTVEELRARQRRCRTLARRLDNLNRANDGTTIALAAIALGWINEDPADSECFDGFLALAAEELNRTGPAVEQPKT